MPPTSLATPAPVTMKPSEHLVNLYSPVALFHWSRLPVVLSFKQTVGTVSVAAVVVTVPQGFVNSARYWLLVCEGGGVTVRVVLVAPGILVQVGPQSVLTCHWTVGVGFPVAAAVRVMLPLVTVWVTGLRVTTGGAAHCCSKAPMSTWVPNFRGNPDPR